MKLSLEHYLANAMKRGVTEHRLVASVTTTGLVQFMVHPLRTDGQTADFITYGAAVIPRDDTGPALAAALAA